MAITTFNGPVASQNGFIENSFTTTERDAIADPQAGLLIYNTDTNTYEVYNGSTFQPAFGGGPAPSGFPKDFTFTAISSEPPGGGDFPFQFTPDGSKVLVMSPNTGLLETYPLLTPWDVTTLSYTGRTSISPGGYVGGSLRLGCAWSADGLKVSLMGALSSNTSTPFVLYLSTPYDIATVTGSYIGPTLNVIFNGITFSTDGTQMYGFDDIGNMFSYGLTTPFECSSVTSGNPTRTVALQTLLGLAAPSFQIAFTSDGAIGFVAQVGTQPVGGGNACQITQFTLGTPFNISTINAGTAVSTTISGVNYSYQSGINVADSNSKLYFSAFNTSWAVRMYEYTFTS